MFNDECGLTQAVLDGRKTMTRRGCKYDKPNETYDIVFPVFEPNDYDNDGNITSPLNYAFGWKNNEGDFTGWNIPQYKVGEVVAVAQSYGEVAAEMMLGGYDYDLYEKFRQNAMGMELAGNRNKMFVRADLMPHHIRITNVKIERLQAISDIDCMAEGINYYEQDGFSWCSIGDLFVTLRGAFAALIDKVSGEGTWLKNPYVFCYSFELID